MIRHFLKKNNFALIYLSLITFILFFDLVFSGLISDDSYNSQIRGILIENDRTLITHIFYTIGTWLKESGRILLGWLYIHPFYYFVNNIYLIKIINLIIIALSSYFFYLLLLRLSSNFNYALTSAFVGLVFMQLRSWHDPIMAFTFLIPLLFLLICLCLVFFYDYSLVNCKLKLFIVNILNFSVVFIYELGFFLPILLYFFSKKLNNKHSKKHTFMFMAPLLLLFIIFIISRLFLLKLGPASYEGVNIYLNFFNFIHAFFIQITSAIPLLYFLNSEYMLLISKNIFFHFFLLFFLFISYHFFSKKITSNGIFQTNNNSLIILFCTALILFPSLIIAISGHQSELIDIGFGYGYIPVYFQTFGLAGLIVYFFHCINLNIFYKNVLCIVFIFILFIHLNVNKQVIKNTDDFYLYPKIMVEKILDHILDHKYEFDHVVRLMKYPSDWKWFYFKKLNRKISICDPYNIDQNCFLKAKTDNTIKEYDLDNFISISYKHQKSNDDKSFYIISKPHKAYTFNNKIISLESNSLEVYDFDGNIIDKILSTEKMFDLIKIYNLENSNFFYHHSLNFDDFFSNDILVNYDGMTDPLDPKDLNKFRWSEIESNITMYNKIKKNINFKMTLHNPSNNDMNIILNVNDRREIKFFISKNQSINISDVISVNEFNGNVSSLKFISDGDLINPNDSRKMVFGVSNVTFY